MDADRQPNIGKEDPLNIEHDLVGPWCACCPSVFSMGWATTVLAVLGVAFGAGAYEANVQENWKNCYLTTTSSSTFDNSTTSSSTFDNSTTTSSSTFDNSCYLELMIFPGNLWIRALKCLIIPLMVTMMIVLPEKVSNIGKVGVRLLGLLVFSSFIAAMEGLCWAWIFQPGKSVKFDSTKKSLAEDNISELESFLNIFNLFVPSNIIAAMYGGDILAIIAVFLLYGIQIQKCPDVWKDPIINISKSILRSTLALLVHVMWFTPIAMFSLICYNLARMKDLWNVFEALGKYVGCQLLGQFVHLTCFYFTLFFFATGRNPVAYFLSIKDAPLTALITSSSAATMPVTLRVNKEAGNNEDLVKFCVPLGAGMNMDGTSLGFPIMVMFTAQMIEDFSVTPATQFTVALLSMVCSMGAAPVPNAGLVFLTMLYKSADIPDDAQGLGYALIFAVDWLIDRVETAQNVTSDSFICGILSHYYGTLNKGCLSPIMRDVQARGNTDL